MDQQAKANVKSITVSNTTSTKPQSSKTKDPQRKEIVTLHKNNSTQISSTPTPIPTSAAKVSQQSSQNSNTNQRGGATTELTTTSPTTIPTPTATVPVQPIPSTTQKVPPSQPPTPQVNDAEKAAAKAAAAQAAKDAFNAQNNQPVSTPIVVSGNNNSSSVTVPSTNGAYSESQIISAPENKAAVTNVGAEVRITTGTAN